MATTGGIIVLTAGFITLIYGQPNTDRCPCADLESRTSALEHQMQWLIEGHYDNVTETPCSRHMYHYLEVKLCDIMKIENDYTTLHATRPGTQPSVGICRVVSIEDNLNLDQYLYTVDLYNQAGWQGPNSGHPGVIFNVIDSDNFDFVYFRPHWASRDGCVQHGYVMSGTFYATTEARCTASPVVGSTWFTVKVESSQGRASVYVNDVNLSEVNAHFPTRSQTGIFVANGYGNVIRFRNAAVTTLAN